MGIHDFDAWDWQEMLYFPPFNFESKFIRQIGQTFILIIISITFGIRHYKHITLIVMHGFDAFVWKEMLFFPPFNLELKFICQMRQNWSLKIVTILFVIEHYNHVIHIGIHDINVLDLQEKLFFPPFPL